MRIFCILMSYLKLWHLYFKLLRLSYFANAGGNISICSRISLRWQQTVCQGVSLSPVPFSPDIQSKYLVTISLRNKLPGWLYCFKKLARGPGKRKREMFLAMYVSVCLCHCWGPFSSMSPAKLACHLSPWSHIVLRQPLQSEEEKGKGGSSLKPIF